LALKCPSLQTVKFVNFHASSQGKAQNELGIRWVLLAVYRLNDLCEALTQIFCDTEFLLLYSMNDSYVWQCRKEIMNSLEVLKGKDLKSECAILSEFIKYQNTNQANRMQINNKMISEKGRLDKGKVLNVSVGQQKGATTATSGAVAKRKNLDDSFVNKYKSFQVGELGDGKS
jgi:hypothetical protein